MIPTKEIILEGGLVCLIDEPDYERLKHIKWMLGKKDARGNHYVLAYGPPRDGKTWTLYLHREILNAPKGSRVWHINGDNLDNRRSNLEFAKQRRLYFRPHEIERFWTRVKKTETGCWIWTGSQAGYTGNKYGQTTLAGRVIRAHRASYIIANGSIPEGMFICHKCDVKLCVNPDHIYAGTPADNSRDAVERGRLKWKPTRKTTARGNDAQTQG